MPIRPSIEACMDRYGSRVLRLDPDAALNELRLIGIAERSQLGEFLLKYRVSSVFSSTSYEELLDLADPTAQIATATVFVREVWGVPSRFVCLTTTEGEGAFLYDVLTEAVFDFDLGNHALLEAGTLQPRWATYFDFLEWYLEASEM